MPAALSSVPRNRCLRFGRNRQPSGNSEIPGELDRHQALIKELGMPPFAAAVTYSSVEGNYMPEEFGKIKFARVGG